MLTVKTEGHLYWLNHIRAVHFHIKKIHIVTEIGNEDHVRDNEKNVFMCLSILQKDALVIFIKNDSAIFDGVKFFERFVFCSVSSL